MSVYAFASGTILSEPVRDADPRDCLDRLQGIAEVRCHVQDGGDLLVSFALKECRLHLLDEVLARWASIRTQDSVLGDWYPIEAYLVIHYESDADRLDCVKVFDGRASWRRTHGSPNTMIDGNDTDRTGERRLDTDTLPIARTPTCHVRLVDDARWPWVMLVPVRTDVTELHHLTDDERAALMREVSAASEALQAVTGCASVNVAALGNVVRRLHVHVVARDPGDPNWPGPVWGFGERVPLARDGSGAVEEPAFVDAVRRVLDGRG